MSASSESAGGSEAMPLCRFGGTPRWTRVRWQSLWTARPPWTDKLPTAGVDSRLPTPSRPDHRPTELKKAPDLEALSYFAPGILELMTRVRTFGGHHRALSHGHAQYWPMVR